MGRILGVLSDRGPMIEVRLMLTTQHVEALKRAGRPYQAPMDITGLVDTGASCTAIDRNLVPGLGLTPTGVVPIHTPSTGPDYEMRRQYDVDVVLGYGQSDPLYLTTPVIESDFASQGFFALIGRDVLGQCRLVYDGPTGRFELVWGADRSETSAGGR